MEITIIRGVIQMILVVLVTSSLVFAAFLVVVIGIRGTERNHGLRNRYDDGLAGSFARRVLRVYVRQAESHHRDHQNYCGQVRR